VELHQVDSANRQQEMLPFGRSFLHDHINIGIPATRLGNARHSHVISSSEVNDEHISRVRFEPLGGLVKLIKEPISQADPRHDTSVGSYEFQYYPWFAVPRLRFARVDLKPDEVCKFAIGWLVQGTRRRFHRLGQWFQEYPFQIVEQKVQPSVEQGWSQQIAILEHVVEGTKLILREPHQNNVLQIDLLRPNREVAQDPIEEQVERVAMVVVSNRAGLDHIAFGLRCLHDNGRQE
jgi:hypothetical protein